MVAQTTGVMLGLLGFKDGKIYQSRPALIIAAFVVVLGLWGVASSIIFDNRAQRHRARIDKLLAQLIPGRVIKSKNHRLNWVWVAFHTIIAGLGCLLGWFAWCGTAA